MDLEVPYIRRKRGETAKANGHPLEGTTRKLTKSLHTHTQIESHRDTQSHTHRRTLSHKKNILKEKHTQIKVRIEC